MNDTWQFFLDPPPQWTAVCETRRSLFHTPAWQAVLTHSFKAIPIFALNEATQDACALTIFPAGPFRVGYLGFPAGGLAGGQPVEHSLITQLTTSSLPVSVHLLRIVISPFTESIKLDCPYVEVWETIIPDLAVWQEGALPARVRRDVRKAHKSAVQIRIADARAASFVSRLYQETVKRHNGTIRYTLGYFQNLLALAEIDSGIKCWLAVRDEQPIAFLTAVREGQTVFYLHGAIDRDFRQYQPSDLLLFTAIQWAKDQGATQFNMMSSPLDQLSLVRYKEKWGGTTDKLRTYDWPVKPIAATLFRYVTRSYKFFSRLRYQVGE
jgi:hypothetical protein